MKKTRVTIENKFGIHARPAAKIVEKAMQFDSEIFLQKDNIQINGKSILSVLLLAAEKGTEILVLTNGPDEELAAMAIVELFKNKFNED